MEFNKDAWLATTRHECQYCGRDYSDEPLVPGEQCSGDCPTENELETNS